MRCRSILPAGTWDRSTATDVLEADHVNRHRRRITLRTASGADVMLDFAEAIHLRHGDGLVGEDGERVLVRATPERLLEITAADRATLLRIAWHLGNRHLPTALHAERLLIRDDHVIGAMVTGLGGQVRLVSDPFDPETGAYGH